MRMRTQMAQVNAGNRITCVKTPLAPDAPFYQLVDDFRRHRLSFLRPDGDLPKNSMLPSGPLIGE